MLSRCSALDWTRQMLHLPVAAQRSFLWPARVPEHTPTQQGTHTHTAHTHHTHTAHTHTLGYDVKSLVWHWSFYVNFYCSSLADFLLFLLLPQLMSGLLLLLLLALLFFVLLFFCCCLISAACLLCNMLPLLLLLPLPFELILFIFGFFFRLFRFSLRGLFIYFCLIWRGAYCC